MLCVTYRPRQPPPPTRQQDSHVSVDREARKSTESEWKLWKKRDPEFQKGINLRLFACSSRTEVVIPTELSGMPHISVLILLILCLQLYP